MHSSSLFWHRQTDSQRLVYRTKLWKVIKNVFRRCFVLPFDAPPPHLFVSRIADRSSASQKASFQGERNFASNRHFSLNCYFLLSSSETFFFLHRRKIETSHAFLIPRAFINLIVEATSILIRPSKRNNTITGYAIDIITNKFQHRRSNNLFHNLTELYFSNVQGEKRKE